MTKKTKIITSIAAAVAAIGAATVGVVTFSKLRAKKLYGQLMKDMHSCGFGKDAEDESSVSYDEIRYRSFTYWIPIPDKGQTYEENLKILTTTFMKSNGIVSLETNPITIIMGRRFYIKSISPDRSKMGAAEIIGLLDSFYERFCSKGVSEVNKDSYRRMKQELLDDIEGGYDICMPIGAFSYSIERTTPPDKESSVIASMTVLDNAKFVKYLREKMRVLEIDQTLHVYDDIPDAVILTYTDKRVEYLTNDVVTVDITITDVIELLYRNYIESKYRDQYYTETDETKFELMDEAFIKVHHRLSDEIIRILNDILNEVEDIPEDDIYSEEDVISDKQDKELVNISMTKITKYTACLRAFFRICQDEDLFRDA